MICRDKETNIACFTPTSGEPASILHVSVFDNDGEIIATYYADEAGNAIDQTTFLGGGTATIGACAVNGAETCTTTREQIALTDGVPVTIPADDDVVAWSVNMEQATTLTTNGGLITGSDNMLAHGECYPAELATPVDVQVDGGAGTLIITRKVCS